MWGTHAEAVGWLERQLGELDRWRAELAAQDEPDTGMSIEKLDSHRDWLEEQLAELGTGVWTSAQSL